MLTPTQVSFPSRRRLIDLVALGCAAVTVVLIAHRLMTPPIGNPYQLPTGPAANSSIQIPGVDFRQHQVSIVMGLSRRCIWTPSVAALYKQVASLPGIYSIAVLDDPEDESKRYLASLGLVVDEIHEMPLDKIDIHGTPTLVVVDRTSTVRGTWVGKKTDDAEVDMLRSLVKLTGDLAAKPALQ